MEEEPEVANKKDVTGKNGKKGGDEVLLSLEDGKEEEKQGEEIPKTA